MDEGYLRDLLDHDPVAQWLDQSGYNDHIFIHVWRIGDRYLVLVHGGGTDLELSECAGMAELTILLGRESQWGNPGEGWTVDVSALNSLVDSTALMPPT